MIRQQYKDLIIEVLNEPTFRIDSVDNLFDYERRYLAYDDLKYPSSYHGIKIIKDKKAIKSCIVIGSDGQTGISEKSFLIDNDQLLICCSNTLFCLALPDLDLKWKTKADPITCFQIFKLQDYYITHGELMITKVDKNGIVNWEFGGADIFVSTDAEEGLVIENDGILVTDFSKTKYKIDFDGKLLWDTYKR